MNLIHTTLMTAALSLASVGAALAADDHKGHDHSAKAAPHAGHDAKAQHGGVVSVVKDVNYELVAKGDIVALYVTDHGKPVDLKGASAKLTLLNATDKSEVTMAPANDRLEARGTFKVAANTKAMANVALPGKAPVAVRFTMK